MPLMFVSSDDDWKVAPAKTSSALIKLVGDAHVDLPVLAPENCDVQQIPLPFYKKAKLVLVRDNSWMQPWEGYYFVVSGKRAYRLDGNSNVIYAMNKKLGLELTPKNVPDYLIFFSAFILGELGAFPLFVTEKKSKVFSGPKVVKKSKKAFGLEAYAFYDGWMFKCAYNVDLDGVVEMMDDVAVACLADTNHFNPHERLGVVDA